MENDSVHNTYFGKKFPESKFELPKLRLQLHLALFCVILEIVKVPHVIKLLYGFSDHCVTGVRVLALTRNKVILSLYFHTKSGGSSCPLKMTLTNKC